MEHEPFRQTAVPLPEVGPGQALAVQAGASIGENGGRSTAPSRTAPPGGGWVLTPPLPPLPLLPPPPPPPLSPPPPPPPAEPPLPPGGGGWGASITAPSPGVVPVLVVPPVSVDPPVGIPPVPRPPVPAAPLAPPVATPPVPVPGESMVLKSARVSLPALPSSAATWPSTLPESCRPAEASKERPALLKQPA